ncbi:hypothetical protein LOD99_8187 [Oopsacas minuta]|uniref:Uncharacterized protein n=1 Tax=Oopsacas minuta TaxID=111878 RepID=A0AAV7JI69_9METZ|nr:hypothetical protein LOD99_8187 [Oopsacas minuta]
MDTSICIHKDTDIRKPICWYVTKLPIEKEYIFEDILKPDMRFNNKYPTKTSSRLSKFIRQHILFQRVRDDDKISSKQEKVIAASYRVTWMAGGKKNPFMDSEIVKECLIAGKEIVTEER